MISERKVNLNAHPSGHQTKALFQCSFQLSQGRAYNLQKVPQSHASKFAEAQLGFVDVRGLTIVPGGLGHGPQERFEN